MCGINKPGLQEETPVFWAFPFIQKPGLTKIRFPDRVEEEQRGERSMTRGNAFMPAYPVSGRTVITIHWTEVKPSGVSLYYDIGIGASAGYAEYIYQTKGVWPLVWTISGSPNARIPHERALAAVRHVTPAITKLEEAQNIPIIVDLLVNGSEIRVARSYPYNRNIIPPESIQIGTTSWAKGSRDFLHALAIAENSGLPILYADAHERTGPMPAWYAKHRIALVPEMLPVGDYYIPGYGTVVDRKANLLELYESFISPNKRIVYEHAAGIASVHRWELVYVTGVQQDEQIHVMKDLLGWSAAVPGKTVYADGGKLLHHLCRHKRVYPHVDFVFCDGNKICSTILKVLRGDYIK